MTREELMERIAELTEERGDIDHQGVKGILCLIMSAMEIHLEEVLLVEILPIQRMLLDIARRARASMN